MARRRRALQRAEWICVFVVGLLRGTRLLDVAAVMAVRGSRGQAVPALLEVLDGDLSEARLLSLVVVIVARGQCA